MGLDRAAEGSADQQRLYARVEDAGLNASATPQQLWADGWLLRFSPGKAKRARCVNALAAGRGPLEAQLAAAERCYARYELPLIFRITPFTRPTDLDAVLASKGFVAIDDTRVMVCTDVAQALGQGESAPEVPGHVTQPVGIHAFAQAVGALRGSPMAQQQAHAQRLEQSPLVWQAFVVRRPSDGQTVAAGHIAVEGDLVGLYDVHTDPRSRGRGLATRLCQHALSWAVAREGARVAYLQVDADNSAARRIYAKLGFVDAYRYRYRLPPGVNPATGTDVA